MVGKKILRYILDMGFERAEIPVRVKFEFEVMEGTVVPDTVSKENVYNRKAVETRYPGLRPDSLERAIEEMAEHEIRQSIEQCGLSPAERVEEKP